MVCFGGSSCKDTIAAAQNVAPKTNLYIAFKTKHLYGARRDRFGANGGMKGDVCGLGEGGDFHH